MHPRDQVREQKTANMELTDLVTRERASFAPLPPVNLKVPDPCHPRTWKCWTLSSANLEVLDPCHPRTWKCWTLSPANLEFKKRTWLFSGSKWLAVVFCGFSELFSGSEWLFCQRLVAHCVSEKWLNSGFQWLGVARQWH